VVRERVEGEGRNDPNMYAHMKKKIKKKNAGWQKQKGCN
jgi:hypothetical protein